MGLQFSVLLRVGKEYLYKEGLERENERGGGIWCEVGFYYNILFYILWWGLRKVKIP